MDIISYLITLIENGKTVGVTGLGTFYNKKIAGRYDVKTHSFLPPVYEVGFTTDVKEDEELVNFICAERHITADSGNYYIQQFAEQIHADLTARQMADLGSLGQLKLQADEIIFEAAETRQLSPDFYGLPPLTVPPPLENPLPPVPQSQVSEPQVKYIPEWAVNVDEDDDDDDERPQRGLRIFLKTLLVLLLIAIAGAVTYFIFPELFEKLSPRFAQQHNSSTHPEGEEIVAPDTAITLSVDSMPATTLPAELTSNAKATDSVVVYEVIESAMKSHKKVDEIIAKMARRGVTAKKIEPKSGRLIKISIGTFTDYNMAKKYQDSLRIKLKNPQIYIQTINPTH